MQQFQPQWTYWGAVDSGKHTLRLVLDYGNTNISAGSIDIYYCFSDENGTVIGYESSHSVFLHDLLVPLQLLL